MGRYLPKLNKTVIITSLLLLYFDMYFLLGLFFFIFSYFISNFIEFCFSFYVLCTKMRNHVYIYNIYATYIM